MPTFTRMIPFSRGRTLFQLTAAAVVLLQGGHASAVMRGGDAGTGAAPRLEADVRVTTAVARSAGNVLLFTLDNPGPALATYVLQCSAAGAVRACEPSEEVVRVEAGRQAVAQVGYAVDGSGWGHVALRATRGNGEVSMARTEIEVVEHRLRILPGDGLLRGPEAGGSGSVTFLLQNHAGDAASFDISCRARGAVERCEPEIGDIRIEGRRAQRLAVSYATGGPGLGEIVLTADAAGEEAVEGRYRLVVGEGAGALAGLSPADSAVGSAGMTVLPRDEVDVAGSGGLLFFVMHRDARPGAPSAVGLSCEAKGAAASCVVRSGPDRSLSASGLVVEVGYEVAAEGLGRVRLVVTDSSGVEEAGSYVVGEEQEVDGSMNFALPGDGGFPPSVTPDGGGASVEEHSTGNIVSFTISNPNSGSEDYDLACSVGGSVTSCSESQWMVTVAGGGSETVDVTFAVGAQGSGTVTLGALGMGGSDDGYYDVTITAASNPVVVPDVEPEEGDGGTPLVNTSGSVSFTIQNIGDTNGDFSVSCSTLGAISSCSPTSGSANLNAGASTTYPVDYTTAGSPGSGTVELTASGADGTDTGKYSFSVQGTPGVDVTPDDGTRSTPVNGSGSGNFTITNNGTASGTFEWTCGISSPVASCSPQNGSVALGQGQSETVQISYTTSSTTGLGTLSLTASAGGDSDSGQYTVDVYGVPDPDVSPAAGSDAILPGKTGSVSFSITNNGSGSGSISLSCSATGATSSCSPSSEQISLSVGATSTRSYTYNSSSTPGTGTITLSASAEGGSDSGQYTISVEEGQAAVATPDGDSTAVYENASGTVLFSLSNPGPAQEYDVTCWVSGQIQSGSCVATPSGFVTIDWNESVQVEATFTALTEGTGRVTLGAIGLGGSDTAWYHVDVNVAPTAPTVTPDGDTLWVDAQTLDNSAVFTVRQAGVASSAVECAIDGTHVTRCATNVAEAVGDSADVIVYFDAGPAGTGTVSLTATNAAGSDGGHYTVIVEEPPPSSMPAVSTPMDTVLWGYVGDTLALDYHVSNLGPDPWAFSLDCVTTGPVQSCEPGTATTDTLAVQASVTHRVRVALHSTTTGTAFVDLNASGTGGTATDRYTIDVRPRPQNPYPNVTPNGDTTYTVTGGRRGRAEFVLENVGLTAGDFGVTCRFTGSVTSCEPADTQWVTVGAVSQATLSYMFKTDTLPGYGAVVLEAVNEIAMPEPPSNADSGWVRVYARDPALTQDKAIVDVSVNPDDRVERSACVTSGAGPAAAFQCGELVVMHSMPAYRTLNRERTLTLIYNSGTAEPYPIVMADVSIADTISLPDSLQVTLSVKQAGVEKHTSTTWFKADSLDTGLSQRVAVGFDASGLLTGTYDFELEVRNYYDSSCDTACTALERGRLLIVNRSASPYGAGWSIAGVEELKTGQPEGGLLLVQGDGSAALYGQLDGSTWLAPAGAYRDTIRWLNDTDCGWAYVRRLRDGTRICFDGSGRHTRSIDRLGQKTSIGYSNEKITSITIAPVDAARSYTFEYDTGDGRLAAVVDPAGRRLEVGMLDGKIEWLLSPGLSFEAPDEKVYFQYPWGSNLLTQRHFIGRGTWYQYHGATSLLKTANLPATQAGSGVITYTPVQARGLAAGTFSNPTLRSDSVLVQIDGPRSVADVATFWVNAYGAPTQIKEPVGYMTDIAYDSTHPLLPQRIRYANGRIVGMEYDAAANLRFATDSTHSSGAPATTEYRYHPTCNELTAVIPPLQDGITFDYKPNCNRLWARDALGNETTFLTDDFTGQVLEICEPGCGGRPETKFVYDATLKNLKEVHRSNPETNDTTYAVWAYQRDSYGNVSRMTDPEGTIVEVGYDLMNRDTLNVTYDSNNPAVSATIEKVYNADGTVAQLTDPDELVYRWDYDALGRVIRKFDAANAVDSMFYDLAGNLERTRTRRGHIISHQYDGNNRVWHTSLPAVSYDSASVPADIIRYSYDPLGNVTMAEDNDSRVIRTYTEEGLLKSEVQMIGTVDQPSDFTRHVYEWGFAYDANGRLTVASHPDTLVFMGGLLADSTLFRYDARGLLDTLTNPLLETFRFHYDARGLLDTLSYPNSTRATYSYYADGSLRTNLQVSDSLTVPLVRDTILRDAAGRVVGRSTLGGTQVSDYDGLGRLIVFRDDNAGGISEHYDYSPAGNRTYFDLGGVCPDGDNCRRYKYQAGRLVAEERLWLNNWETDPPWLKYEWYEDGSLSYREGYVQSDVYIGYKAVKSRYYYDASGRMTGTDSCESATGGSCLKLRYRYDAFGRKILEMDENFGGIVRRFVYQGDDVAYKITASQLSNEEELDQTFEFITPHPSNVGQELARSDRGNPDWWESDFLHRVDLGSLARITRPNGQLDDRFIAVASYTGFGIPSDSLTYSGDEGFTGEPRTGDAAGTGLIYLRNRHYDPNSGRFTQEDPIGFAGGINLYAYAGNNPASYTDPFGLCVPDCLIDAAFLAADINDIRTNGLTWGRALALGADLAAAALPFVPAVAGVGVRGAQAAGRAGETAAGIIRNTSRIPSATGTAAYRIPDALSSTTLSEVKNVSRLGLTRQLRDFMVYAQETGRTFELYVRPDTRLSGPLQEAIGRGDITLRFIRQ